MKMTDEFKRRFSSVACNRAFRVLPAIALCVGFLASPGAAQSNNAANARNDSTAQKYFTDVELINQDGKPMRFYTDLLKDKVVIINVFFTACTSVCPPMSRNLEKIQTWLGDRMGKDAHIISISVDSEMDTPTRLKGYARKFNAKPGWYFLSGKKQNVELALRKIGMFVEARDDHSTIMVIGNLQTGLWKKAMGLARPDQLIEIVDSVLNDNPAESK